MPAFTVKEVAGRKEWDGQHGTMVTYTMDVATEAGATVRVQMNQKPASPAPTAGQVIDGTLDDSNPNFPPKLKKSQQAAGGGFASGGRMDPETQARIVRQHSQKMSLQLAALKVQTGEWTAVTAPEVQKLIDFFHADAWGAKP